MSFQQINPGELKEVNPFELIGKDWMLITSGTQQKFNTMTASWGSMGVMWNKNVTFCFVRPQRYTFEFLEQNQFYTLSFFGEEFKKSLMICGRKSGRDIDKVKESGLTPDFEMGVPYFKEAKVVMVCKKIYSQFIDPQCFIDSSLDENYSQKDYHKMYIGEIAKCMVKN